MNGFMSSSTFNFNCFFDSFVFLLLVFSAILISLASYKLQETSLLRLLIYFFGSTKSLTSVAFY